MTASAVIHLFRYYTQNALCGARRGFAEATRDRVDRIPATLPTCMSCIATRKDDDDSLYAYAANDVVLSKCYVEKDGLAHAATPAPTFGWFFQLCAERRGGRTIYAVAFKHLKDAPVTCLECLDVMSGQDT
jgi:hypothetical protein